MGQESSAPNGYMISPYTHSIYTSIPDEEEPRRIVKPYTGRTRYRPEYGHLIKSDFAGIWSVIYPNCFSPRLRSEHFTAYDKDTGHAYIGYGISPSGVKFNDVWALNTVTKVWRKIETSGHAIKPRYGSRAVFYNGRIYVFGGCNEPDYFAELHSIDVATGEVEMLITSGPAPTPRSTPIMALYENQIFVWGGFNDVLPSDLHVLDLSTMSWSVHPQDIVGRSSAPSAICGNRIYSFGSSKNGGILVIDLDEKIISLRQTCGTEPPSSVYGAGFVRVDKYILFFGGMAESKWTLVYGFDTEKLWWFVFHIRPDGHTTSLADGVVSKLGLFMLPRIHSFSMVYEERTREVLAFLGTPEKENVPITCIEVGEALAILHMREDMQRAFRGRDSLN